ncbi:MAG TPA: NAD(P)-binding protein [Rhizomicrobium sp.]|nr:NAD(P)-binding protein [Rhizomicrobium sp.]
MDRRDFLNSTLLASGSVLLSGVTPLSLLAEPDWNGFSGVGDYAASNGNTYEVMTAGHAIRDRLLEHKHPEILDTGESFDCIVVGGGISGLSAALFFARGHRGKNCLVLDNHPIFGGEAKRNEFEVDGKHLMVHQGSAACFPPLRTDFLASFYDSIGIDWKRFQYQEGAGAAQALQVETAPYGTGGPTSGFYFGAKFGHPEGVWVRDPWGTRLAGAPISESAKRELLGMREADRKPFSTHRYQPKEHGDAASRHLDSVTLEQHLMDSYGLSRETVRTYLSPISGGGSGLGADALSAYCEYAADVLLPWDYEQGAQMFPGGNTGVARHILKQLIPAAISGDDSMPGICRGAVNFTALDGVGSATRVRLNATVVSVKHAGDPARAEVVEVVYEAGKKLYRVRARAVIMAGGSWTSKHVLQDLPATCREAYAQFHRSPCLMANVAVRNWRFLNRLGLTECQWFEGIGNSMTLRKVATFGTDPATIDPNLPTVLTLKILFSKPGLPIEEQTIRGRTELLNTSFRTYESSIRDQFTTLFAKAGFDAERDIAGIVLNRWGHAYLSPQPGFFFGTGGNLGPGDVLRRTPYGRIAFANSDLSGIMDHRMSILEARRAVSQIPA